jgi:excisionase family DNA binding protein
MPITLSSTRGRTTLAASAIERRQAHDTSALVADSPTRLVADGPEGPVELPNELAALLSIVMNVLGDGGNVAITSLPEDLTTTMAADQLGVSRPTVMRMVKEGKIPAHRVGSHTRLSVADVMAFKRERLESQAVAFEELREIEEELGLE